MLFHQQHFHDAFKLQNPTWKKKQLWKMKAEENTYAFILTTIFFNRWHIVSHIKSQASALKHSNENKS